MDIYFATSTVEKLSPLPFHSPCLLWIRCRSLSRRSTPGSGLPVDSAVSDCCWLCWRGGSWVLRIRRRSFKLSSKLLVLVWGSGTNQCVHNKTTKSTQPTFFTDKRVLLYQWSQLVQSEITYKACFGVLSTTSPSLVIVFTSRWFELEGDEASVNIGETYWGTVGLHAH